MTPSPLPVPPPAPTYREAVAVWARVACLSFGGPAGQVAVMHRILVDEKGWISDARFLHALSYCTLLPGPEAQQLATYVGWLLHGRKGGLTAGLLFVLPGFLSILALSTAYALAGGAGLVGALLYGVKPAVLAVVAEAVVRIGRRVAGGPAARWTAALAFVALFLFGVPFPVVVLVAGAVGWVRGRHGAAPPLEAEATPAPAAPSAGRLARTAAVGLAVWLGPLGAMALGLGGGHVLVREGVFFSQAAVVTFGGAYAVLAYVAQEAVERHGWLEPGEMLDGLGMAETTPGPLIQVVQFVGFLGAYRQMGGVPPLVAGLLGSVVTAWATFAPCFLWIFAGAPYVERLRSHRPLSGALAAITAAVVGVVLNLAVWFGLHVLFGTVTETRVGISRLWVPDLATLDPVALGLAVAAFVALFRLKLGVLPTLALGAALGLVWRLAAGG